MADGSRWQAPVTERWWATAGTRGGAAAAMAGAGRGAVAARGARPGAGPADGTHTARSRRGTRPAAAPPPCPAPAHRAPLPPAGRRPFQTCVPPGLRAAAVRSFTRTVAPPQGAHQQMPASPQLPTHRYLHAGPRGGRAPPQPHPQLPLPGIGTASLAGPAPVGCRRAGPLHPGGNHGSLPAVVQSPCWERGTNLPSLEQPPVCREQPRRCRPTPCWREGG